MTKHFKFLPVAGLMASLVIPLQAGEGVGGWHAGASLSVANDSLRKANNKTWGMGGTIGLDRRLLDTSLGMRPSLSLHLLPGNYRPDGTKLSLINIQVATDLLIPTGYKPCNLVTGLSISQWRYHTVGRVYGLQGTRAPRDLKVGFRFGVDVQVRKNLSGELLLQMVELGRDYSSNLANKECINPSWVQAGFRYHF